jgi:hypothetical protein
MMKYKMHPNFQERSALSTMQDLITASKYAVMHAMQKENGMQATKIRGRRESDVEMRQHSSNHTSEASL